MTLKRVLLQTAFIAAIIMAITYACTHYWVDMLIAGCVYLVIKLTVIFMLLKGGEKT